jgi:ribosomal protein S18 acetylase RimI-like enzyme
MAPVETAVDEIPARQATAADAVELTRLRAVMIETFGSISDDSWRPLCISTFEKALSDPEGPLQAFVTDAPGEAGVLASCAAGVITTRLPSPRNPQGRTGYILSVATDPRHRRRGHARASVSALLDWFHRCGIHQIDLNASEYAESLYRGLGFTEPYGKAMRLITD